MKRGEIEKKKEELNEILKSEDASARLEKLKTLAKEVGASITRIGKVLKQQDIYGVQKYLDENQITECEIVHNIQFALQIEVTIDMCKTAGRNFWIAVISAATALVAMLAAWAAVIVKIKCGQ